MDIIIAPLLAFLIAYLATPLLRALAVKYKIVDFPGGRKIHKRVTPLLGGVAIYLGVVAGTAAKLEILQLFWPALIASTLILIVGVIDDIWGLSAEFRLLCQLLAAGILITYGVRVTFLPASMSGDLCEIFITIIWIVGVTNAFNYLDGMDGLAAGSVVINLLCFLYILHITGQRSLMILATIIMGACLGFMPYNNFRKAKIFLGDAGSTLLGFTLAYIALIGNWATDNIVKISIPILIVGVPIFDMIFTTVMRIREEKIKTLLEWLKYGGRDHFHHYLVDLGLQPSGAVVFIYAVTLSLGISAIMVSNDRAVEAFLALSQALATFGVIATLIVVGKRRRSGWEKPGKAN